MNRHLKILLAFVLTAALPIPATLLAQSPVISLDEIGAVPARIRIDNFGKVNGHFYRGSEPDKSGFEQLAAAGIKTVINLRTEPSERAKQLAESAGLRYVHLPMHVRHYPPPDLSPRFLALISASENQPVYVYCHGGRHRTGVLAAIFRMEVEGWDAQRAYAEMRQYGFYKRWGHGPLKAYVFDYYRQLKQGRHASDRAASFKE